jgi:phosphate:Na+ symporter
VPRQIANAHTMFNVVNTLIFIWFTVPLARLVERLVPERPEPERIIVRPKFLDKELLSAPSLALERARLEIGHLGGILTDMLNRLPGAMKDAGRRDEIRRYEDKVDILYSEIIDYLRRIHQGSLTSEESVELVHLVSATDNLESIGDVVAEDLLEIGEEAASKQLQTTDTLRDMYQGLFATVVEALEAAVRAVEKDDELAAQDVLALKEEVHGMVDRALQHQVGELTGEKPLSVDLFRLEMEAVDKFKRIYALAKRIAKGALPEAVTVSD